MKKRTSIGELAKEADLASDEVLLRLWEAGIGSVSRASDSLVANDL